MRSPPILPEAPRGWSREVNSDISAGLAMMGGGAGAEAVYTMGSQSMSISFMADSPMIGAMAGMIANAGLMGAKLERVGRMKFINQDGELTGLVDNRIMMKGEGDDLDALIELLESIDYRALADFGG